MVVAQEHINSTLFVSRRDGSGNAVVLSFNVPATIDRRSDDATIADIEIVHLSTKVQQKFGSACANDRLVKLFVSYFPGIVRQKAI